MYDSGDFILTDHLAHLLYISYIGTNEFIVGFILNILEIGEIARISKFVEVDNLVIGIFVDKQTDHMRSYEAGSTGNQYIFHFISVIK